MRGCMVVFVCLSVVLKVWVLCVSVCVHAGGGLRVSVCVRSCVCVCVHLHVCVTCVCSLGCLLVFF